MTAKPRITPWEYDFKRQRFNTIGIKWYLFILYSIFDLHTKYLETTKDSMIPWYTVKKWCQTKPIRFSGTLPDYFEYRTNTRNPNKVS
jgi:hypothetical protein